MAKGIENSEELKELYKDIKLISTELDRTNDTLNTCIQRAASQEKQSKRAIEMKREDRKIHFKHMQQTLTDKFDRYVTDVITFIREIQKERTKCLTTELNEFDKEQTVKEQKSLESLEKVTATDVSKMRSLLATDISFKEGIKTVSSDLNQKQKSGERCRLLLALKSAAPAIKIQKQKIQELTAATALQVSSYVPEQTKESISNVEFNNSLEVPCVSTLMELPDNFDVERLRDFFRKVKKLRCSNTKCGANGSGNFCQWCGYSMVELVSCTGKLNGGRICLVCYGEEQVKEEEMLCGEKRPTQILVRNLPSNVNKDFLYLVFENTRRYGGGHVLHVTIDEDSRSAVVEFEKPEAVDTVLAKCPIQMMGPIVDIKVYKQTDQTLKLQLNKTIKVAGVDTSLSRETLEFYFENARRSGGGEIETVESDEEEDDVLYFRFKHREVAEHVASRRHRVEGREINVAMYMPQFYNNRALVKGLRSTTTQDYLLNFIQAKSQNLPKTVDYHATKQGVAMITFFDNPDLVKLENIFKRSKLEGASLEIYPVQVSSCIIVGNLLKEIDKDIVESYFESERRSCGGDVERVLMKDDQTCLVFFMDFTTIERVIERRHVLMGQRLDVKRYHKCLGGPEGLSQAVTSLTV